MTKTIILATTVTAIVMLSGMLGFILSTSIQSETVQLQPLIPIAYSETPAECVAACGVEAQGVIDTCVADFFSEFPACFEGQGDINPCIADINPGILACNDAAILGVADCIAGDPEEFNECIDEVIDDLTECGDELFGEVTECVNEAGAELNECGLELQGEATECIDEAVAENFLECANMCIEDL